MVAFGVSRFGQDKGTGDERALFLKLYAGEVLLAFERMSVTDGKVFTKKITQGKSATFPVIGSMGAGYHTPGHSMIEEGGATPTYLQKPKSSEKIISVDGFLISPVMVPQIDEAMSHFDTRSPYVREMSWALAKTFDLNTMWTIVSGAEDLVQFVDAGSDWGKTGSVVTEADFETDVADVQLKLKEITRTMTINDVPEFGRHAAVTPLTYQLLTDLDTIVGADYTRGTGTSRAMGMNVQLSLYGMAIHMTNRLADLQGHGPKHAQQFGGDYTGTLTNIVCVAWHETKSVGVVRLLDLGIQTQYLLEYIATLLVGGFAVGHGVLHQSSCFAVKTS